jgi:poly(3-hydroxybutyrate) depolymerase
MGVVLKDLGVKIQSGKVGTSMLYSALVALLLSLAWFAVRPGAIQALPVSSSAPIGRTNDWGQESAGLQGGLAGTPFRWSLDSSEAVPVADVLGLPSALSAQAVITSQPSTCMAIDGDGHTLKTASSKMLFVWEGTPSAASLVLTSCGVKPDKHHTVYINGQPVVQVEDDPFSSACVCVEEGQTGQGGHTLTYPLDDPTLVVRGWNHISITNDQDVWDDWVAYNAKLVLTGSVTQSLMSTFGFESSYDGSERHARYQLPIGYDPAVSVPLLVSIAGTKEDQKWEDLYRFAAQANERGWLLLSPNLRNLFGEVRGRTASLENQHDIIDAINYMKAHFAVDADRIYMSGFSTGGGIAATVAAKYPHVFAAVVDWAGPTDLGEWEQQLSSLMSLDFGCPPQGPGQCPLEWQRRSARSMTENLKHVPLAIVHGRADAAVPFEQSEKLYLKMAEYYDPAAHNKMAIWHDGGHADQLPSFDGLAWMAGFTLNPNPTDIMIRADEDKDYYWVSVHQRAWIGKFREGWSAVLANYDPGTRVISATVQDQRLYENGFLPLDVSFDLSAIGLDLYAGYTVEDYDITTGDYVLRRGVLPADGELTVSLERDELGGVYHQYLIYPFEAPALMEVILQQHVSPDAGYDGAKDTHIYQYNPTQNYAGDDKLVINYGRSFRGLLKFELDTIPPQAEIKEAHLRLYLNSVSDSGSIAVSLHRLLAHWVDGQSTWNVAVDGQPWGTAGAQGAGIDYDPAPIDEKTVYQNAFVTFNLKSAVREWLAGATPNEGVLILGPELGSGSTRYRFDSSEAGDPDRRPALEIRYMVPSSSPTPTPGGCTLAGSVVLQGRPPAPHPSWSVPLTVTISTASYSVTTDQRGNFTLSGLTPGTYDIGVKNRHTLRNLKSSVTLAVGTNAVSFGTLLEGDANDDNYVNISDFSLLRLGFAPGYDERVDFNEDGIVNISDFSLLAVNFGRQGSVE